jgi:hypothetical protein
MKTNPWLKKLIVTATKVVRHPYSREQKYLAIRSIAVKMVALAYFFKNPHIFIERSHLLDWLIGLKWVSFDESLNSFLKIILSASPSLNSLSAFFTFFGLR